MNKVGIIQSNYIPWKGYFDIIHEVDIFIFYDDVKYTKNDWRNRNKIKGANGTFWISVPVPKESVRHKIEQVELKDHSWQAKHFESIKSHYLNAQNFSEYEEFLRSIYLEKTWTNLSELNQTTIKAICQLLGIKTQFLRSSDFKLEGEKTDRLVSLLKQVDADYYLTGPKAKEYMEEFKLAEAGIELAYKDYSGYPEYDQLWGPFEHNVSILDLLLSCGKDSPFYIWGWRDRK